MRLQIRAAASRFLWAVALLLIPVPLSAQFIDQHFQPIPTPPDSGLYPAEVQQAIDEGYRQLLLVTDPSDDAHLEPAKEAFERALALDPNAIHAWNGKGIYEITKDEQWLVILESLKKLFNRDHISMAVKAFEKAVELDPDFHAARYNLALAHRQGRGQENYKMAARELEELVTRAPDFADAALLLALTFRDANDLESTERVILELPETASFPAASRQLLLAYTMINADRPEEGTAAYWQGLELVETPRQADFFWHDIRPISNATVDAQYANLDVSDRAEFIRAFWQRLADQSFVTSDDRLVEHYRRLRVVYENYRIDIPERRHYSGISAYVPPWQTGFDDRGVIYLRHGPPDDVAVHSGPEFEQNVSWKYERGEGDPLIFHFVADEDVRDYKLVRRLSDAILSTNASLQQTTLLDPNAPRAAAVGGRIDANDARILATQMRSVQDLYRSRGHLDPNYDRVAMGLDSQILEEEEARLAQDISVATQTATYDPEPTGPPFLFPAYATPFRSQSGRPEIGVYFAVPTAGVDVLSRGGGSGIDFRYQLRMSAANRPDSTKGRADEDVHITTPQPLPTGPGVMIPRVEWVPVSAGEYTYGLKLTDLNSGRSGILHGTVGVEDFSQPGLSLSGVVLASRVEPAAGSSNPFVRWNQFKVLPIPSRMFRVTQPVFVYYEVYGLRAEDEGEIRYRTTYELSARERDRNVVARFFSAVGELLTGEEERGSITYSFEREQPSGVDPLLEYFSLDVSGSEPGDYTLSVEVEHMATGESRRREIPLTLVQ